MKIIINFKNTVFILCSLLLISCKKEVKEPIELNLLPIEKQNDTLIEHPETTIKDTSFINIQTLSNDFIFDLKYATTDNFLHQKVYDCPDCYLRKNTAIDLMKANKELITKGFRIKLFDCYRPLDIQKKMWKILSVTNYVTNPKKGYKHNRGAAVDLILVDSNGN